jgi:ureidoacrylate peracid hydrolase
MARAEIAAEMNRRTSENKASQTTGSSRGADSSFHDGTKKYDVAIMQKLIRRLTFVVLIGAPFCIVISADSVPKRSSEIVTVDAKPDPIAIDPARSAVIVVDMENDFAAKGGMFDRAGVDISGAEKAIAPTARVLAAARQGGLKIIYLKMGYAPDLSDLGEADSVNRTRHLKFGVGQKIQAPDGRESRVLIRDTWDTDIVRELKPQPNEIVIYKIRFSGFYKTDLDATLKKLGIKYLIVAGVTTSICVESTVRDAMFRDYLCIMLRDCMSEPIGHDFSRTNHEASLLNAEALFGWVSDSDRFIKAVSAKAAQAAR